MNSMGIILDLIIVVIAVVSVIVYMKRGFVKTVVEFAGFFVAVLLAFNLSSVLAETTYTGIIRQPVINGIESKVSDIVVENGETAADAIWNAIPGCVTENAENFNISKDHLVEKLNLADITTTEAIASATDEFVKPVVVTILSAALSLLIFLVVSLLFKLLAKPLNALFSAIPLVGNLNKTLGGVLGLGNGVVYALIFCAIISCIVAFTESGFLIFTRENIEASALFELLCKLNPIY